MTADPIRGGVGPAARLLGFAGLLPQTAAVLALLWVNVATGWQRNFVAHVAGISALLYGGLILSFLGGIWWGFAMRRGDAQAPLAALAVSPSLVAFALMAATALWGLDWSLVAMGGVILLTLLVDRRLCDLSEAPGGWMQLRRPLSVGLGGLTILAGILTPH
jgi:hypothetical protein